MFLEQSDAGFRELYIQASMGRPRKLVYREEGQSTEAKPLMILLLT